SNARTDRAFDKQGTERRNTVRFRTITTVAIISLSVCQVARAHPAKKTNTSLSCDDAVTCRQYNERRAQMNDESMHAVGQSQREPRSRVHAVAKVTVQSSEAKSYDQTPHPALMEINITEAFTGDLDGESTVRALQVQRDDKSASLVSVQRF